MARTKKPNSTTKKPAAKPTPKVKALTEEEISTIHDGILSGDYTLNEAVRLFGFQIGKKPTTQKNASFALPPNDDGAITIQSGGIYGTYVDLEGTARNKVELITRYRDAAQQPECESAIDDIVNEAVVDDGTVPPVVLNTDELDGFNDSFKADLRAEFLNILKLLGWRQDSYEIFKKWYVDGRLYYHIIIDNDDPEEGIQELRGIDPRRIDLIRETKEETNADGVNVVASTQEYYMYNQMGISNSPTATAGLKIATDSVAYVHSGIVEETGRQTFVLSWLHKALKFLNQLRHMEDAVVIYRLSRAPERRIFYIDIGNLPKIKADQYMRDVIQRYRNKLVYNANTGQIQDDKKYLSMMEDFFLPRREGSTSTQIDTLSGAENLGVMTDVEYFEKKLYRALGVPVSRLESEGGFNLGRSAEISRDEEKFYTFIVRLRKRFSELFDILLERQLVLKNLINSDGQWDLIRSQLSYTWAERANYAEMRETEILRTRFEFAAELLPMMGTLISRQWIWKNVLRLTDEEIKEVNQEIEQEKSILPDLLATQQQGQMIAQQQMGGIMQQTRGFNQLEGDTQ